MEAALNILANDKFVIWQSSATLNLSLAQLSPSLFLLIFDILMYCQAQPQFNWAELALILIPQAACPPAQTSSENASLEAEIRLACFFQRN